MRVFVNLLLFILGFFVLIAPNSFQLTTAALLLLINALLLVIYKKPLINSYFIFWWIFLSAVFGFFISISDIKWEYKSELTLKYVLFPILWLNIFSYIKACLPLVRFTKFLFGFSFFSLFLVIFLYFSLLNGYNFAQYFIQYPGVDSQFLLGFRLHVYGNLIFFATGIFLLSNIYNNKIIEYLYILLFIIVALISGRSALVLSLAIGFLILLIRYLYNRQYRIIFIYLLFSLAIFFIVAFSIKSFLNYDFSEFLQAGTFKKLQELGGEERTSQSTIMFNQILSHPWGIGFNNIGLERNWEKTFEYEVLIVATILRFGVIGFIIILISLFSIARNIISFSELSIYKRFYLIGFFSIITFSFTNPYLESFSFQWMFFGPLVFLSDFTNEEYRWSNNKKRLKGLAT